MSIVVAKLSTGQDLIADFTEVRTPKEDGSPDPAGELLYLQMHCPLLLGFTEYLEESDQYKVSFDRYMPFCRDVDYRLMPDKIMSVGRPTISIRDTYIKEIFKDGLPEHLQREVDLENENDNKNKGEAE